MVILAHTFVAHLICQIANAEVEIWRMGSSWRSPGHVFSKKSLGQLYSLISTLFENPLHATLDTEYNVLVHLCMACFLKSVKQLLRLQLIQALQP